MTPWEPEGDWPDEQEWPEEQEWEEEWEGDDGEDDETPDSAFLIVDDQALVAVDKNPLYRGCLVVDTGCSCSVSSLTAAELIQLDRLAEEGEIWNECLPSDKTFWVCERPKSQMQLPGDTGVCLWPAGRRKHHLADP